MSAFLTLALTVLSLQSAGDSSPISNSPATSAAAGYSDGEIAELVYDAIVSDLRALAMSSDQFGRAAKLRPDVDVARDVETALRKQLKPVPTGLSVSCHRGNVLLRGHVTSDGTLQAATKAAGSVNGVRAVLNRMSSPEQAEPDAPPAAFDDALPTRTAPFAFLTSDGLAATDVVVDVADGEVFVTGLASSTQARTYVTSSAGRVPGARMVRNKMALRPINPQEDERLGRLVMHKFKWEQSLHGVANGLSVSVRNGILKLSGKVDSEQQAALVRHLAADTTGIIVLDDKLTVAAQPR